MSLIMDIIAVRLVSGTVKRGASPNETKFNLIVQVVVSVTADALLESGRNACVATPLLRIRAVATLTDAQYSLPHPLNSVSLPMSPGISNLSRCLKISSVSESRAAHLLGRVIELESEKNPRFTFASPKNKVKISFREKKKDSRLSYRFVPFRRFAGKTVKMSTEIVWRLKEIK